MATYRSQVTIVGGELDGKTLIVQGGNYHHFTVDLTAEGQGITKDELEAIQKKTVGNKQVGIAAAVGMATIVTDIVGDKELVYIDPNSAKGFGVSEDAKEKGHLLLGSVRSTRDGDVFEIAINYPLHTRVAMAYGDFSEASDPQRPENVKPVLQESGTADEKFKSVLDAVSGACKLQP